MPRELFAAACLIPLVIACAPCAQAQDYALSPDQLSLVDKTCTQVMGFRRGETWFAACQESLSQTLPARSESRSVATADIGGAEVGKSFYEVGPSMRWNRERQACAWVGLLPGSTVFHQCAANLDGAFLPRQN